MTELEQIVVALRGEGVDARLQDGWLYVALGDGRIMAVGGEYGASLTASFYHTVPDWFESADKVTAL